MLRISMDGDGIGDLPDRVRRAVGSIVDERMAYAEIMAEEMERGNREGVLAGLDRDNKPMPITRRQQDPRLSARFGSGPPLAPKGAASRSVAGFVTTAELVGDADVRVTGSWPSAPFFAYHARGTVRGAPVRDIKGVRPTTKAAITERIKRHMLDKFRRVMGR